MIAPPPGRPKAAPADHGDGEADEPPSPPSSGQRREFAEHRSAPPEPAGCAKPAVGQGRGGRSIVLAGDIGGTKTLLGLAEQGELVVDRRYANADFQDFDGVLAAFLADTGTDPARIEGGCLAVAGPLADDGAAAQLTNLPWRIECAALARRFGLPALRLANDFAAAAMGAVTSSPAQRHLLQAGEPLATAPCLVVGAGTGLGMAIVLPEKGGWRIVAGEGGHAAFAPADDGQLALWRFLRQRHGRVTWERVVSGPGLSLIHESLCGTRVSPKEIAAGAAADPAGDAARALDMFLAAYGAFAGDMALACLARGGVYIAGGIAATLLPQLARSGFLAAFGAKAEHAAIAARMPISVCTDPLLGLRGALALARQGH